MTIELPRMDGREPADALLREAEAKLAARDPAVPSGFVAELYDHTAPEDQLRYAHEDLAALAARGYAFLRERTPDHAKIS